MNVIKMNTEYRIGIASFEHFAEIQNKIKNSTSPKIEINCENTTYISPAFHTLFGSLPHFGDFYGKRVIIKYNKNIGKRYIQDIGLDKYYNKLGQPHKAAIPFSSISGNEYIKDEKSSIETILKQLPIVDKDRHGGFVSIIGEILNNAKDHSGLQGDKNVKIYCCGHWNAKIDSYIISVYDTGMGITQNVSGYLNKELNALKAMEWAFGDGNSTQNSDELDYTRGIGLNSLENFIKANNGMLYVASGSAICVLKNGKRSFKPIKSSIKGTVYVVSVPIKGKNIKVF